MRDRPSCLAFDFGNDALRNQRIDLPIGQAVAAQYVTRVLAQAVRRVEQLRRHQRQALGQVRLDTTAFSPTIQELP